MNKINAKITIEKLVERFDAHLDDYKRSNYNETHTRNDFINPLFEALGWDITDKLGLGVVMRDVIHEDKIKIGGLTKAPDYCFTIHGSKKFFLEAKRPGINIKDHIDPAYQVRRYGWNAKLPVSILTDFEEFSIYDCAVMPQPNDRAVISRIKYFTYKDYITEFDFLWDTFSKENVIAGSLDKFAVANKSKKGTEGVDAEFLKSLDSWRDVLARNLVLRNSDINEDELNYALQKIIDRIIFLRICEDRGIEPELQLFNTIGLNTYQKLQNIFDIADQKYNSGLFDFRKDVITGKLNVDDKALKTIIEEMYYPKSPYEFSVIPVEILGHSYEQYLGKVIMIDSKHKISIDEKPEVRKAGGVYYTPQYIVDYIVRNTLGKLIGDGRSGLGVRGLGIENDNNENANNFENINEGVEDGGNKELSGFDSLAGFGRADNANLYNNENIPERRNVLIDFTNEESGSISSIEHSGGERKILEEGIHSSSVNSNRVVGGIGNTAHNIKKSELHNRGISNSTNEKNAENRSNARSINQFSEINSRIPNPKNQAPNAKPLTPDDVAKIKIVDPACGSGSFLLGAYKYLLEWHLQYYQNAKLKNKAQYLTNDGRLTNELKKKILINNIFGVDIDTNAVEVTKLSLMLQVMEGETSISIEHHSQLIQHRVLPSLDKNILSGNSFIDFDFYDNQIDFTPGAEKKIKPFNWQNSFPEVFKQGGFDVVIGNPPYGALYDENLKEYLITKYDISITIADTYIMFMKKAKVITKLNGIYSYIVPSTWLYMSQFKLFRKYLIENSILNEIQLFRKSIFDHVTVQTCTFSCYNALSEVDNIYLFKDIKENPKEFISENYESKQNDLINTNEYNLVLTDKKTELLFNKIKNNNLPMVKCAQIVCGLTPYRLGKGKPPQDKFIVDNRIFDSKYRKDESYRQYIMGRDFNRYSFNILEERWLSYGDWLAEPRYKAPFNESMKIIIRQTSDHIIAHIDNNKYINLKNVHNLKIIKEHLTYNLLLGILNSKLIDWWYKNLIPEIGRVFAEVKVVNLEKLPIIDIDKVNKVLCNKIELNVNDIIKLNKDLQAATLPEQKEQLKSRIQYTDQKIDKLVYELYELTDDEIKIVEGE